MRQHVTMRRAFVGGCVSVRQRYLHDHWIAEFLARLDLTVIIESVPTGIGDVVEVISDNDSMSRISEVLGVGLNHVDLSDCIQRRRKLDANNALGRSSVLNGEQCS